MRRIFALALLATTALAAPAQAAGLSGMGANIFGSFFNFSKANLEQQPVKKISAGKLDIDLQRTKLSALVKAFGGTIQSDGDATWVCYSTGETNNWFISNALGGQEFVMMVAVEAASRKPADCDASESFTGLTFNVPGLGAKTAEIKAHFGSAAGSGKITYRADQPGGYTDNAQYLGYQMKGGAVAGIGVGETSIPTTH
ncbi:MAG: hypothetical protein EOP22_01410 [Hyphomicrobiales bacterium]|nr:MAG: hypothetical protein EOP22_01410 [Hyphomicrobiales bacterium]